jgi:hypothetical protein
MENLSGHNYLFGVGNLIAEKGNPDGVDIQTGLAQWVG